MPSHVNVKLGCCFVFFYLLLRRSISDHYLRSCGYVTCSRPQRTATGGLEPGTSRPKVLGFTTASVRSTKKCIFSDFLPMHVSKLSIYLPIQLKFLTREGKTGSGEQSAGGLQVIEVQ